MAKKGVIPVESEVALLAELSQREPGFPVVLRIIDIKTQVLLKVGIGDLSLAVRFRVVGRREGDVHVVCGIQPSKVLQQTAVLGQRQ